MLYVVGSVLVVYIAIRAYRHVSHRSDPSVALPRPVNETTPRKSLFAFTRTNGGKFSAWKLPVPWSRSPARSSFQGKAANTTFSRDLSIELLPTTALPPPPTLIPTSPPLVDLSTPSALEASTGSRFSASLPSSPRRQALSLWQQLPSSPGHSLKGHINILHPAFPRPPSPHALLATTPPQRQKRSRSLGGVPVRRLSGGQSGLRNKLDVELLDLVPGHARETSEEHLLIDFSSSSDNQVPGPMDDPATISPAASDIGILPPSNKIVEPRPMPLVDDIGDDSNVVSTQPKSEPDDDTAWMWFNSNAPSTIRSYDARVLAPRTQADPFMGERKFAFPLPLPFPKIEKLIDIPSEDACLELNSLDSSRTLVEVGSDLLAKEDYSLPHVPQESAVDIDVSQTIDPFSDDYAVDYIPSLSQTRVDKVDQVQTNQDSSYSPLVDVGGNESQVQSDQHPPAYPLLIDVGDAHTETSAAGLVFGDSQISSETNPTIPVVGFPIPSLSTDPSSQAEQTDWHWVEANDPWADHVTMQDETLALNPAYGGAIDSQDIQVGNRFMETSPGGSLLATSLDADDEVPHLSLDDPSPAEELRLSHIVRGQLDDEDEEDATPRPTPVSIDIQLPASDDGNPLPGTINTDMARYDIPGNTLPIGHDDEQAVVTENFPDPDLLPLPEFNSPSSIVEVMEPSINHSEDEQLKFEPRLSPQMLTPPASPPSLSPALLNQRKAGKSLPPSPMNGPKNLSVASDVTRGRSRSPHVLLSDERKEEHGDSIQDSDLPIPCPAKSTEDLPSAKAEEDAETMELDEMEENEETSLPGSLSEVSSTSPLATSIAPSKTAQTVASLFAEKSGPASFYPSVRAIVRQPVEIALAMQLRPGLGAGADPAWMVRFLMAMFGWFAVLVSGQENY